MHFKNVNYDDASHDIDDDDWWGSECDSEDKVEFDFVNPLVGSSIQLRWCPATSAGCCRLFTHMRSKCSLPSRTSSGEQVMAMVRGNLVLPPGSGNNRASTSTANQRHVVEMLDASKRCMAHFRDGITDAMWADYVAHRH
ncbi:hypothetical protein SO802_032157 [Lithocarpus litseifolius]|uniref:Uncharacterized protein n=1 Tax=Lithocarpus litseifolius TaxID=425828 RepID=A0AAW2BPE8_9ROSI